MLLAQSQPDATDAFALYRCIAITRIDRVLVCNGTGSAATWGIFVDAKANETNVFTAQTAISYGTSLAANSYVNLELATTLQAGAVIGVQAGTADAISFSLFGEAV